MSTQCFCFVYLFAHQSSSVNDCDVDPNGAYIRDIVSLDMTCDHKLAALVAIVLDAGVEHERSNR